MCLCGMMGGLLSLIPTKTMVIVGRVMEDGWVGHDETKGAEALQVQRVFTKSWDTRDDGLMMK
jgi:hypothetical protein